MVNGFTALLLHELWWAHLWLEEFHWKCLSFTEIVFQDSCIELNVSRIVKIPVISYAV